MSEEIKLIEGTIGTENVSTEEFAYAYIKMNLMKDYNHTKIYVYDDYYSLSSPSPKTHYEGYHKTLVCYKSGEETRMLEYTLVDILENIARIAYEEGFNEGANKLKQQIVDLNVKE